MTDDITDPSTNNTSADLPEHRKSDWTCRLPVEIVIRILSNLADGHHAATLATVQKTNSVMYRMTTPLLYKHLRLRVGRESPHPRQDETRILLSLFTGIPKEPEVFDQIVSVTDDGPHPLDIHRYHRLRWALLHVISITLIVNEYDKRSSMDGIKDYVDISTALRIFNRKTLWPAVHDVHIQSDPSVGWSGPHVDVFHQFPNRSTTLFAFGPTIRPTHLRIDLHDRPLAGRRGDFGYEAAQSPLWPTTADHVMVTNMTHGSQGIPRATKSLTIDFGEDFGLPNKNDTELHILRRKVSTLARVKGISNLTVIGFERGLDTMPIQEIHAAFRGLLASFGPQQSQNFRYRVRPWRSNAGNEELGDWHTVDDPCRKDFFGNEDNEEHNEDTEA